MHCIFSMVPTKTRAYFVHIVNNVKEYLTLSMIYKFCSAIFQPYNDEKLGILLTTVLILNILTYQCGRWFMNPQKGRTYSAWAYIYHLLMLKIISMNKTGYWIRNANLNDFWWKGHNHIKKHYHIWKLQLGRLNQQLFMKATNTCRSALSLLR